LREQKGHTTLEQRQQWATKAFAFSAQYDTTIQQALQAETPAPVSLGPGQSLRYGENPHQQSFFHGNLNAYFDQLNGKQLSHNNLVDVDAAVRLIEDLPQNSFAVIKHTNPCGVGCRDDLKDAWELAYNGDPVSAFGGILVTNSQLDEATATAIGDLFFEVLIAPDFEDKALEQLKQKKNRIILKQKQSLKASKEINTVLDGVLQQDRDLKTEAPEDMQLVTQSTPLEDQGYQEMAFANTVVKHAKSNAIVLTYNHQLVGIGVGQTSRVDALRQAIAKARYFDLPLKGASMASDAFFPFSDSVAIAYEAGIQQVIQPGGSKRDEDSINFCNDHGLAMVTTGIRHFKH
jgi:phosphoribosylaminoimidazolecarboxamide formyltransferase/IMP cyclohydrolase